MNVGAAIGSQELILLNSARKKMVTKLQPLGPSLICTTKARSSLRDLHETGQVILGNCWVGGGCWDGVN